MSPGELYRYRRGRYTYTHTREHTDTAGERERNRDGARDVARDTHTHNQTQRWRQTQTDGQDRSSPRGCSKVEAAKVNSKGGGGRGRWVGGEMWVVEDIKRRRVDKNKKEI